MINRREFLSKAAFVSLTASLAISQTSCVRARRRRRARSVRHVVLWGRRPGVIRLSRRAVLPGHLLVLPNGREGTVVAISDSQITLNIDGGETYYPYEDTD